MLKQTRKTEAMTGLVARVEAGILSGEERMLGETKAWVIIELTCHHQT